MNASLLWSAELNHCMTHSYLLRISHTNLSRALTVLAPFFRHYSSLVGRDIPQSNFTIECICTKPITKELLGLHKFVKNRKCLMHIWQLFIHHVPPTTLRT